MANEQNLMSISERSTSEQREIRSKGGKNSGKARRQKADLRKMAQAILDGTFTDKKGNEIQGYDIIKNGLIANLADSKSKNWGKAMDLLIQLTGANVSKEQKAKAKAEADLAKAKIKAINSGGAMVDVEDLKPLAEMLNDDKNTDESVETVLEET